MFLPYSSIKLGVFLRRRRGEGERTLKAKNRHARRGFAKGTVGMAEEGVLGEIHPPTFGKPPLGAAREGLKAPGWGRGHSAGSKQVLVTMGRVRGWKAPEQSGRRQKRT